LGQLVTANWPDTFNRLKGKAMPYYLMSDARPPFSDWFARVERELQHRRGWIGSAVRLDCVQRDWFKPYYDTGCSPREAADDWMTS
jgi:hypothetical protein